MSGVVRVTRKPTVKVMARLFCSWISMFALFLTGEVVRGQTPGGFPAPGSFPLSGTSPSTPPAAVPTVAGVPEFDALRKQWDELRGKLATLQSDYKSAKPADRPPLAAQFDTSHAEGEALRAKLVASAETAFRANPQNTVLSTFLSSMAIGMYGADRYEEALQAAETLIAGNYPNKRVYNLAGKAAFALNDFDKAETYLKIASDNSAIDGRADGLLQYLPAYKTLWKKETELRAAEAKADDLPRVLLKTSQGDIVLELFENEAPKSVANFISLVEKGFYNGLTFHRVLREFMAQGGDPQGNGGGGPGYHIPCECYEPVHRLHFRGALSMAHAGKDTGGSQFFITFLPTWNLDGTAVNPKYVGTPHTVFGRVLSGFEVLPKITRREPARAHGLDGSPSAPSLPADRILEAKVLRKRAHPYEPTKMPEAGATSQAPVSTPPAAATPRAATPAATASATPQPAASATSAPQSGGTSKSTPK